MFEYLVANISSVLVYRSVTPITTDYFVDTSSVVTTRFQGLGHGLEL